MSLLNMYCKDCGTKTTLSPKKVKNLCLVLLPANKYQLINMTCKKCNNMGSIYVNAKDANQLIQKGVKICSKLDKKMPKEKYDKEQKGGYSGDNNFTTLTLSGLLSGVAIFCFSYL